MQAVHKKIKHKLSESVKQIDKIMMAKDSIVVKCGNKQEVEEISELISHQACINDAKTEIETINKPRIQIVGVELYGNDEDLESMEIDIKARNKIEEDEEINLIHKYLNNKTQL